MIVRSKHFFNLLNGVTAMASKTIHICDCCKKQTSSKDMMSSVTIARPARDPIKQPALEFAAIPHDLCDGCKRDYKILIEDFFNKPGVAAP